jgi:hypothetical protein
MLAGAALGAEVDKKAVNQIVVRGSVVALVLRNTWLAGHIYSA